MPEMMPVQRPCLGGAELAAVQRVFERRWLGMGPETGEFERTLRELLGVKHIVAVGSGTAALHLALECLDLQAGDEVVVPSLTFAATSQAVLMAGARPVFCDVREDTLAMDAEDAARRITARTKVLLPVHYGGTACEMDALLALARERGLRVVEDAAHAFGSSYRSRKIGTLGDITCFSFDPIKNITCGEGGALATDNDAVAARATLKRTLGVTRDSWRRQRSAPGESYDVVDTGYRYHMSDINAAIGLAQLTHLESFRRRKQAIARRYDEAFRPLPGLRVREQNLDETFPFFYVLRVLGGRRAEFVAHLAERGISTGLHYIPNHLHSAFACFADGPLPVCERVYAEIATLPLFHEMTDDDVTRVIDAVASFVQRGGSAIVGLARPGKTHPVVAGRV